MNSGLLLLAIMTAPFLLAVVAIPLEHARPASPQARASGTHSLTVLVFASVAYTLLHFTMGALQAGIVATASPFQFMSLAALPIPEWLGFILCFLLIDLLHYGLHVLSHSVPVFWRLHKVHHADDQLSALSGLLHHPLEMLYVTIVTLIVFVLVGMPVVVIMAYSAVVGLHAVFSHLNLRMPGALSRSLGWLIVLPDFHRIHHSARLDEAHGNFGTIFSFWDLLFGTRHAVSAGVAARMKFGLPRAEMTSPFTLPTLVALPFQSIVETVRASRDPAPVHRKKRK